MRKLTRRKLLVVFGGTAGLALLSACGQQSSPAAQPAKPAEAKPTEAPKPAAPAAQPAATKPAEAAKPAATAAPAAVSQTGSGVKIVLWGSFSGNLGDAEQAMVKRFNE